MRLSDLKIDSDRADNGGWVDDIPGLPGVRLKVRWTESPAVRKSRSTIFQEIVPAERRSAPTPEDRDRVASLVLADAVLLDWEGLEGDDGEPLVYDRDRALMLLSDPDFRLFANAVAWASSIVQQHRDASIRADEKN